MKSKEQRGRLSGHTHLFWNAFAFAFQAQYSVHHILPQARPAFWQGLAQKSPFVAQLHPKKHCTEVAKP